MEVYGSAAAISLIAFSCMLGGLIQWFYFLPRVAVCFKKERRAKPPKQIKTHCVLKHQNK
jgi:hypothetical protein